MGCWVSVHFLCFAASSGCGFALVLGPVFGLSCCRRHTQRALLTFSHVTKQERTLVDELVAYNCDPDTEYNEVASLFLSDADTAIRQVKLSVGYGTTESP